MHTLLLGVNVQNKEVRFRDIDKKALRLHGVDKSVSRLFFVIVGCYNIGTKQIVIIYTGFH